MAVGQEVAPPIPAPIDYKARVIVLTDALSASGNELTDVKSEQSRLRLQLESLGLSALKSDTRSIQERLLKAVAALSESEEQRQVLMEANARLAEAAAAISIAPNDAEARTNLDEALKAVNASFAVQKVAHAPVALESARIVSYKSEIGLAVLNAGASSGLRMGAPIRIMRGTDVQSSGIVVDLRDRIAGIMLTGDGSVKAGDTIVLDSMPPSGTSSSLLSSPVSK